MLNNKRKFGIDIGFREFFQDSEGRPVIFEHISFMGTAVDEEGIIKFLMGRNQKMVLCVTVILREHMDGVTSLMVE